MARILVTGATGFIGRHLVPVLLERGHELTEAGRRPSGRAARFALVNDIGPETDWSEALTDVDAVIHLAGLAHCENADEAQFFAVNDLGTRRLVESAEAAGVRALVAISSIAAREAERVEENASSYGRSKLAGEAHVRRFADTAGKVGVILRPPLVYGHDAPGNWRKLQRLAATGVPLPFGAVANRRSLCSVGNLSHAIAVATEAALQGIGSGAYEIADRDVVSLAEILTWLRAGMGRPSRLLPVPANLMRLAGDLLGKRKVVSALLDDLTLDPSPFMRVFAWSPREEAEEAIKRSGQLFAAKI